MKIAVFRKEHFCAVHRLYNPKWSDEKNDETFGKCNNPNWHGHNYEIIVRVAGEKNPNTGYVYDLKKLKEIIQQYIIEKFDHKNLNLDIEELAHINPTSENLVVIMYSILREKIASQFDLQITLYETERNFVQYPI